MAGPVRDLADLERGGGCIRAECRRCNHVAIFAIHEIQVYWKRKRWTTEWPGFARHLKCRCGERNPKVSWLINPPPPDDDPLPPRPRFTRSPMPKGEAQVDNVVPIGKRRAG